MGIRNIRNCIAGCQRRFTRLGISALANRKSLLIKSIMLVPNWSTMSVSIGKKKSLPISSWTKVREGIGKKKLWTLFGSWSIIYGFSLQLSDWVERFFTKRFYLADFIDNSANNLSVWLTQRLGSLCRQSPHSALRLLPSIEAPAIHFWFSFLMSRSFYHKVSAHLSGFGATPFGFPPRFLIEFRRFFIDWS